MNFAYFIGGPMDLTKQALTGHAPSWIRVPYSLEEVQVRQKAADEQPVLRTYRTAEYELKGVTRHGHVYEYVGVG